MRPPLSNRFWLLLLSVVFVLTAQLIRIDRPYRGHFASYQGTVMASMARNMLSENFTDIFYPKTDGLIFSGERTYHLNQYPLPSLLAASAIKLFGGSFEFWGRFQAIIFNLLSVLLLWGIVRKITDETTADIASILFLISPYSIIYGQAFMCESLALCCLLASLRLALTASPERKNWLLLTLSAILFSVALVNRVHFILFFPPMIFGVGRSSRSLKVVALFLFLSLLLPFIWYGFTYWASLQNLLRTHTSLFFQATTAGVSHGASIISAGYWKRIFDIFALNISTPLVSPFLLVGLVMAFQDIRKYGTMLMMYGFGFMLVFLFPQKLVDHDFYLYGLLPFVVFFAAVGIRGIFSDTTLFKRKWVMLLALLCFMGVSARYFLHPLFSCSPREKNIAVTGHWIQSQTQPSDILILAGSDTAPLSFYVDRRSFGFPMKGERQLPDYIKNRRFTPEESIAVGALETAMKDDISLLEFYRSKGASFLFISSRAEAEQNPVLLQYLRQHYSEISSQDNSYYFFKLSPS